MRSLALTALLLLVAACGSDPGDATGSDDPAGVDVAGRTLVVTEVSGHELVPGSQVTLAFRDGQVRMHAGCNHLMGDYVLEGDTLTVSAIGGTEMGCPEPLMEQDRWLVELFSQPVTVAEEPLRIEAGDVVLELSGQEEERVPLTGTTWVLDGLVRGESVSTVPGGVEATLRITEDGRAEVFTGCNGAGGEVEVGEDRLRWGSLVGTLIACEDERGEVERVVRDVLRGRTAYDVTAGTLTIRKGERGLVFRAGR